MRVVLLAVLIFAATLSAQELTFEIKSSLRFAVHGNSHEQVVDTFSAFQRLRTQQRSGLFSKPASLSAATDFVRALTLFDRFADLRITAGHGATMRATFEATATLAIKKTRLSISVSHNILSAWDISLDKTINSDVRLTKHWGWEWLQDLDALVSFLGPQKPATVPAFEFAQELIDAGYTQEHALLLAWIGEQGGYGFNPSAASYALALQALQNNFFPGYPALEGGANPLKDNRSGLRTRTLIWKEVSASYSHAVLPWLDVASDVRLLRAQRARAFTLARNVKAGNFFPKEKGETRYAVSFGWQATAHLGTAELSLSMRDVNAPRIFEYEFQPQATVDFAWQMAADIPLTFSGSFALNRTEHPLLPHFYEQEISGSVALHPAWDLFGFTMRIGFSKNVGDANEPWALSAGLGFRVWRVELAINGETSFSDIYGMRRVAAFSLPSRFALSAALRCQFKF